MSLKEEAFAVLDYMKNEEMKAYPCRHWASIWFYPERGVFLYADLILESKIFHFLKETDRIVFKGIESYQDEKMIRYTRK